MKTLRENIAEVTISMVCLWLADGKLQNTKVIWN
jgi:hypothetical protein